MRSEVDCRDIFYDAFPQYDGIPELGTIHSENNAAAETWDFSEFERVWKTHLIPCAHFNGASQFRVEQG